MSQAKQRKRTHAPVDFAVCEGECDAEPGRTAAEIPEVYTRPSIRVLSHILYWWFIFICVASICYAVAAAGNSWFDTPWTQWSENETRSMANVAWTPPALIIFIPTKTYQHRHDIYQYVMIRAQWILEIWWRWLCSIGDAIVRLVQQVKMSCERIFYDLIAPLARIGVDVVLWLSFFLTQLCNWIFVLASGVVAATWSIAEYTLEWTWSLLASPVHQFLVQLEGWVHFE